MNNQQLNLIVAVSLCASIIIPNVTSAAPITTQGDWTTTLQGRDLDGNLATVEAYYDTSLNISWLANANYDALSWPFWSNATAWAASLNFNGITGWRLPATVDAGNDGCTYTANPYQGVDCGTNITTQSELSHMFYVTLGNEAITDTSGVFRDPSIPMNTGLFSNVSTGYYWSSTEYAPYSDSDAWTFNFYSGGQGHSNKGETLGAWAVHAGDVGAAIPSSVPVPTAAWLFSSGLLGLLSAARRKSV